MTIWEILIGAPIALIIIPVIILAVISFTLLIVGFPFLAVNLYKNYRNQTKISLKEILEKTYF
ncbi:MAG: hypothetical protein Q7K16_02070 [Candidatus Azambacteria bacterium]|nr:hypothetical protein [Candidatus Azambacteria bacterium]